MNINVVVWGEIYLLKLNWFMLEMNIVLDDESILKYR